MKSTRQYKCPDCKHSISIASAEFIKGIAMTSCSNCGRNAFAIDAPFSHLEVVYEQY